MAECGSTHCEKIISGYGDQRSKVDNTTYPYCHIASLEFIFQEKGSGKSRIHNGTGFLARVKKSYQIITAAHLATHDEDLPLNWVQISLGRDGLLCPYGMIVKYADDVWIHPYYSRKNQKPNKFDLASIVIQDADLKKINKKNVFCLKTLNPCAHSLQMSGYPGYVKNDREWKKKTQWEVDLMETEKDGFFIHYKNATTSGNSGSPIYTEINGKCYVTAMHIVGGESRNTGLIFTMKKLEKLGELAITESETKEFESDMDTED